MNVEMATPAKDTQPWHDEITQLLTEPLRVGERMTRTGTTIGLRLTPQPRKDPTKFDLLIRFFSLFLSSSEQEEEARADRVALGIFVEGLQDPDVHVRLAACEALEQLGDPAARPALETALQDEDRLIQVAAAKALAALKVSRIRQEDLSELQVLLWQQVKHLWKPIAITRTNRRGEARVSNVPTEAICRLQLLSHQQPEQETTRKPAALILAAKRSPDDYLIPEELAAASLDLNTESLPQSWEEGSLLCTLYRNVDDQLIIEFRSEAPELKDGWVHFTVINQATHAEILSEFVALAPDAHGVLTGSFVFSEDLDLKHSYEIQSKPVPAPS